MRPVPPARGKQIINAQVVETSGGSLVLDRSLEEVHDMTKTCRYRISIEHELPVVEIAGGKSAVETVFIAARQWTCLLPSWPWSVCTKKTNRCTTTNELPVAETAGSRSDGGTAGTTTRAWSSRPVATWVGIQYDNNLSMYDH